MNDLILALKAYQSDVEIHKHSAYQIVFTTDNLFVTVCDKIKYEQVYGFIIRPQVAHACTCSNSNLIIMNVEAYSFMGKKLAERLGHKNAEICATEKVFMDFFNVAGSKINIQNIVTAIQSNKDFQTADGRIQNAISIIHHSYKSNLLTLDHIAKEVFLSPSRLAFLFKQKTGSSIMKFLVWLRTRNAIALILSQKDTPLTAIAYECGFYDSSQMNKYMYQMFGISPSKLRKKSDLIQFLK